MTDKTSLGDRMKGYEAVQQSTLLRRTPIIIRVDGKAFHTYTRKYNITPPGDGDPFSPVLHYLMLQTAQQLCGNIQNAVLAYTQSDEISILLRDYDKHETQQWFGGKLQKMASVSAAMATAYFNWYVMKYDAAPDTLFAHQAPLFDARVFNLPKEEVTNYFIWRQQDASRNSVSMLARHYFSQKEVMNKDNSAMQDMLHAIFKVNWNDLETWKRRGSCVVRNPLAKEYPATEAWITDKEIPIFTQDRDYIEKLVNPDED